MSDKKLIDLNGDEGAVWDFSKVSRKWHKRFMKTISEATRAQVTLARPAPEGDAGVVNAHYDAQERAVEALERLGEEQQALIAEVLVSVPAGWLSSGAPDGISLSEADHLDWLTPEAYAELLRQVQTGEAWANHAKN